MVNVPQEKEYIVLSDESVREGRFFSNFYGGVLVGASQHDLVAERLEALKKELGFTGEIKWSKVTDQYLERYVAFVQGFFAEVREGRLKVRIMFTANANVPPRAVQMSRDGYFKLYYQFIKHAFGLKFAPMRTEGTKVRLLFDQWPQTGASAAAFRAYLTRLGHTPEFRQQRLLVRPQDIAEVRSHDHVMLQGLDVVLGAMAFRLNDMHREKPAGELRRGRRTIAKEKLYRKIREEINALYPNFNIGISTGMGSGMGSLWTDPYRHWSFVASGSTRDREKTKKKERGVR